MGKSLFIAEKPSTMKMIKEAYENSDKPIDEIDFFPLAGHICKLCEPKDYDGWNVPWKDRPLPMIPSNFKVGPLRQDVIDNLRYKITNGNYDSIIVGTDSDVEGNGIYDLIEKYLNLEGYKAYRFFESDLTPAGIMKSMKNLQDYHTNPRDVGMTEAFRIRSRFDWLIGFNMSVAYTVKSGFLMKVGRVKAPTLKLVYDNCKAIDEFNSKTAYQPCIKLEKGFDAGMVDEAGKTEAYPKKEEAESVLNNLTGSAVVDSFIQNIKKTPPNQLYKLTDIQYEAGQKYGYTPEKTLELIQSLYETRKMISYPRTDGRYVSSEKSKDFKRLINAVAKVPELSSIASSISDAAITKAQNDKRFVDDKKVQESSHDALIPTGDMSALSSLSKDERNICDMIFRRFLAIFLEPLEEEKTKIVLTDNGCKFSCNGSKVINPGFTILYKPPADSTLPSFNKGDILNESEGYIHEVVSKPPQRFTQATLIKAMENIQKYVTDDNLKNVIKKAGGIGQPSSRAAIISELISTGYVKDITKGAGKGLHMTEEGKKYIENLGNSSIVNPKLSAEWEMHMNDIKDGSASYDEVYSQILEYLNNTLEELNHIEIKKLKKDRPKIGKCPQCGKDVVEYSKAYGCSGYPECKLLIPKEIAGKIIPPTQVDKLLKTGHSDRISGFKSKAGKTFSSALILKDGTVSWESFEQLTELKCPKCGKEILKTPMSYKCSDKNCGFTLWRQVCKQEFTEDDIKNLLEGKETRVIKGLKSSKGNIFNAKFVIKDGTLSFIYDNSEKEYKKTDLACPVCGSPILEKNKAFSCSDKGCDFFCTKIICSKKITENILKDIIEKGETSQEYKFKGKNGTTFKSKLIYNKETKHIEFPPRK